MKVTLKIEDDSGRTYEGNLVLTPHAAANRIEKKKSNRSPVANAPRTPTAALKHLHAQGVFRLERTLAAVEADLSKIDCNFPKASLAKALERAGFLTRRGKRGNYRWVQKYKPGG